MLSITLFVDNDAASGGNGQSWDTAYNNLQAAITESDTRNSDADITNNVDQIWIAEGTYKPGANRTSTFLLRDGVNLYGGFAGTESSLLERDLSANHTTTLSGDIGVLGDASDNVYSVVFCDAQTESVIDGLVISDGNADQAWHAYYADRCFGGGVYNEGTLTIANCTISENLSSLRGGGVFSDGTLTIIQSLFTDNITDLFGAGLGNEGEAIIDHSIFSNNTSVQDGGAIYNATDCTLTITNSTISNNAATYYGGGILNDGTMVVEQVSLLGNTGQVGAGINSYGDLAIINSTIASNTATRYGGGIENGGSLKITNSTLTDNSAGSGGGLSSQFDGTAILHNTIIAGNTNSWSTYEPDIDNGGEALSGSYNLIGIVSGQSTLLDGVNGNQVGSSSSPIDPQLSDLIQFANGLSGYVPLVGSPVIDTGNNAVAVYDNGIAFSSDIAGNSRIANSIVDIGVCEFGSQAIGPILFVDADAASGGNGITWETAYSDLQDALEHAAALNNDNNSSNDISEIWIAEGTYYPTDMLESGNARSATFWLIDDVTLYGGFTGTETTIADRDLSLHSTALSGDIGVSGDASDNIYTVVYCDSTVEAAIDGILITGGNADYSEDGMLDTHGGGIYNLGVLSLTNATISDNSTKIFGGGAYNQGTLTITKSTLYGNSAGHNGGGVYSKGILSITDSTISNNASDYQGGGVANSNGTLTINNSTITENTAVYGAGILTSEGTLSIVGSTISGNSASKSGGGIHYAGEDLFIANSTISGNLATERGGGFYGAGKLSITDSSILNNSASGEGGGFYHYNGILTITNSTISNNSANGEGGGILVFQESLLLTNSTIADNSSGDDGGGIYSISADITITNSVVTGNSTNDNGDNMVRADGGGIYCQRSDLIITGSTISNNLAYSDDSDEGNGGGIYHGDGDLTIVNATIVNNSSTSIGGGIVHSTGNLSITNSTIANNTASNFGGGLFDHSDTGSATINNSIVAGNTVGYYGADIYFYEGILHGSNNLIGDGTRQTLEDGINGNQVGTTLSPLDPGFNKWIQFPNGQWGYTLSADSPCVDAGRNSLAIDPDGTALSNDITGNPRIQYGTVDIGSHEYCSFFQIDMGGPYTIYENESVSLDASGSQNSVYDIISYEWDFDHDGNYDDGSGETVLFIPDKSGTYTVHVKLTDSSGTWDIGETSVKVKNCPPIPDAGGPYVVDEGSTVTLDASGSFDLGNDIVSYVWDLNLGGEFDDAYGITVDYQRTKSGSYAVILMVIDDDGACEVNTAYITVNNVAPTADAGGPYTVDQGHTITLDAFGSTDPGNDIVLYEWDLDNDGLYDDATGSTASFSNATCGTYPIGLKVTDEDGATSTDSTFTTVNNAIPTANAGGPYTIAEGETVTLDASGSTDLSQEIVSYEWDLDGDGQYDDASGITTEYGQNVSGNYTVSVKVIASDGDWDIASATVVVTPVVPEVLLDVNPVVAGSDVTFSVTYSDNFAISTATIGDGDFRVTGPNGYGSYATLIDVDNHVDGTPRTATYRVISPNELWTKHDNGTYQIVMVANQVSDTAGNYVAAGVLGSFEINVSNLSPIADLGGPYAANEDESVMLDASASRDLDGTIVSYAWDFDGDGEYDDATGMIVNFTPTASGNFTVGLQVTDDEGAAGTDSVEVTINNIVPTADAGGSYGTREGLPVTLDASGSTDPGNDIVSYAWDFDGDGEYDDAFGVTVDFNPTHSGDQTVSVKVTDDDGDFDTADAQIAVRNIKPTADAGGPYTCLVGETLTLDASASADPGNDIVSYEWDFNSDAVYDDAEGAVVQFPTSTAGTFVAAVKVTDDDGASSTALALVTIQEKPVQDWGTVRLNLRDLADTKDIDWLDEWSGCWIEVWATGTANNAIGSFDVELTFEADCFTPELAMVQPGEKVNSETLNVILNESTGNLQITGTTLTDSVGQGSEALLAKLAFKPTPGESVLPRDTDGKYLEPVADAGFHAVQAGLTSPNSSTIFTPTIAPQDDTPLWPVMYDLNGDSTIDLMDVAQMLAVFQWTTDDNATPMTWASDFDRSGAVDLLDVAEMLARFQYRKSNGNSITYPAGFPFDTPENPTEASAKNHTYTDAALAKATSSAYDDYTAIAKDLVATSTKKSTAASDEFFTLELEPYADLE